MANIYRFRNQSVAFENTITSTLGSGTNLTIANSSSSSGVPLTVFQGSLTTSAKTQLKLGVAASTNNTGILQFNYSSSASAGNSLGIGLEGSENLLQISGTTISSVLPITNTISTGTNLTLTNNASSSQAMLKVYQPNLANAGIISRELGVNTSNFNFATQRFVYTSTGSVLNYLGIGLKSVEDILVINGNQCVGINNTAPVFPLSTVYTSTNTSNTTFKNNIGLEIYNIGFPADSAFEYNNLLAFTDSNSTQAAIGAYRKIKQINHLSGIQFLVNSTDAAGRPTSNNTASSSLTEVMRITPEGNVGIGTIAPSFKLDVSGTIRASGLITASSGLTSTAGTTTLGTTTMTNSSGTVLALSSAHSVGDISTFTSLVGSLANGARNNIVIGKAFSTNNSATYKYFHTTDSSTSNYTTIGFFGNDDILTVQATDRVGINNTAPSVALDVSGSNYTLNSIIVGGSMRFPPIALSSNPETVTGQTYGNGLYTLSQSNSINGGESVLQAFDSDDITTQWSTSVNRYDSGNGNYLSSTSTTIDSVSYLGEWIQIQLPVTTQLSRYEIFPRSISLARAPNIFYLAGSNDGSTWTMVDSRSGISGYTTSGKQFTVTFNVLHNGFIYYRIVTNKNNAGDNGVTSIGSWKLYANNNTVGTSTSLSPETKTLIQSGSVTLTNTIGTALTIGASTQQFPQAINIIESVHATSRRAGISLGNWQIISDINGNGTKDFSLYDNTAGATRFSIGTSGLITTTTLTASGLISANLGLTVTGATTSVTSLTASGLITASSGLTSTAGTTALGTTTMTNSSGTLLALSSGHSVGDINTITSLTGSLANGTRSIIIIGKAFSTNNSVTYRYFHTTDSSTSNYTTIGFFGNDDILTVQAQKRIGINNTAPSAFLHIKADATVGGSGDFTNATNNALTLESTSAYPRIIYLSNDSGISALYNYQTNKDVYWGESADVGNYILRGRKVSMTSDRTNSNAISVSNLDITNTNSGTSAGAFMRFLPSNQSTNFFSIGAEGNNAAFHVYNQVSAGVFLGTGSTSWAANSDFRIKRNIADITDGLNIVLQLEPVTYNFISDDTNYKKRGGFIAQSVQQVLPNIVSTNPTEQFPDGLLGISMTEMIPYIVKSIHDLNSKIQTQQNTIDVLTNFIKDKFSDFHV